MALALQPPSAEAIMPDYRAYPVDANGHVLGVPVVITCDSDDEGVEKARPIVNGRDVEVWEARFIVKIESEENQT
jgi:hypothetical protein